MNQKQTDDAASVLEKISELPAFQDVAYRLHELILEHAPDLKPRLWYGMPGYAHARGKPVVVFFRVDDENLVTFGITAKADLTPEPNAPDRLLESAWFLTELDDSTEQRIARIVEKAARQPE